MPRTPKTYIPNAAGDRALYGNPLPSGTGE